MEESEDQFQMALRSHLSNIDSIIQLHDNRLYALEKHFQKVFLLFSLSIHLVAPHILFVFCFAFITNLLLQETQILQEDFVVERDMLAKKFAAEKNDLQSVINHIETEEQSRENDAKYAFEQLREEIRNRALEEINMLRILLDGQIEELEHYFESAHLHYLQQTAQRTHDFKELTQTDQKLSKEIEHMRKKVDTLQTSIQHWRAKSRQLGRETEERNRLLLVEKHTIQKHYQQLKARIKVYRNNQTQRLLHLSQMANTCMMKLSEKLETARTVVGIAELSRKMETDEERVQPYLNTISKEVEEEHKQNVIEDYNEEEEEGMPEVGGATPPKEKIVQKFTNSNPLQSGAFDDEGNYTAPQDRLQKFYLKYNKVLMDCISVEKEKERLEEENDQLQDLIKQYIDGTQLPDGTLDADNPLFVVNGRANLNAPMPVRMIAPTVQEANVISSTAQRQYAYA